MKKEARTPRYGFTRSLPPPVKGGDIRKEKHHKVLRLVKGERII
jgi:hypothetical protein